jgi:hypothetical protein
MKWRGPQTPLAVSFTGSKFLRPNDLTIATIGVRIENSALSAKMPAEAPARPMRRAVLFIS